MKFKLGLGYALLGVVLVGCHGNDAPTSGGVHPAAGPSPTAGPKLSKLITEDVKVGTGPAADIGDTVSMEYRGTFADGSQFDSNVPAHADDPDKAPLTFQLAEPASVIEGWVKGIRGMKVGGERKLSIPWTLAYGKTGKDPIPPETDLYFDVKLLGLVRKGHEGEYLVSDLKKGTGRPVKSGDWVTITYSATLLNNMDVDDSTGRDGGTFQFQAGTGDMGGNQFVSVTGIPAGVIGMQVGGERMLTLPPALATPTGAPPNQKIPAGSTVRYDVKLLRVLDKKGPTMQAPKS